MKVIKKLGSFGVFHVNLYRTVGNFVINRRFGFIKWIVKVHFIPHQRPFNWLRQCLPIGKAKGKRISVIVSFLFLF